MSRRLLALGVLLILALAGPRAGEIHAQSCANEVEPNNDPAHAQALAGCVAGTLTENDQDIYRFTVTPDQANQAFVLVLNGVPNALTKAELLRVQGADLPRSLVTLSSTHGDEVRSDSVILSAGDYLIGVYSWRVGAYRLQLGPGEARPASGARAPGHQKEQASGVTGALNLAGTLAGDADWYAWTLSAADAGQVWNLTTQAALDRSVVVTLYDAAGSQLARRERDNAGRATFAGLKLPAGVYLLQIQGDGNPGSAYGLSATSGAPLPNAEAEPNDQPGQANPWTLDTPLTGQLNGTDDLDIFRFTIDAANANTRFDLRLRSNSRARRRLWLRLPDGTELQNRDGLGEVVLADLSPAPGDYLVVVTGDADPTEQYTLSRTVTGTRQPGHETEPNDTYQTASPLDAQGRAVGRFAGADTDIYRLDATGKPQYWRIQVTGDGINKVRILDAIGDAEHDVGAQYPRRVRLTDVVLLPGTHYIEVQGKDGAYQVMAIPLGPPPEGVEQEPNDSVDQANPLAFGAPRTGLLNELGDVDSYRFTLATREHIRLTVIPPDDGRLQAKVWWGEAYFIAEHDDPALGSPPWVLDTILQPDDYVVRLGAIESGDSPYVVKLERGDPFASISDLEPNDTADLAGALPATLDVTGTVGAGDNYDWYRLPKLPADTGVEITAPPAVSIDVYDAKGQSLTGSFQRDSTSGAYTGALQAAGAQPYVLRVGGNGAYEVKLAFDSGPAPVPAPPRPPLTLTFGLQAGTVAAFWPVGQTVSGTLRLANTGAQPLTVSLDVHSSDGKITAQVGQPQITIPGGGRQEVAVAVAIAADLPVDRFPITWRARTADGGQVTAGAALAAGADAPPQAPHRVWPMPDAMLGGLDAALLSLGAQIVTPDPDLAQRQAVLHDGYTGLQDAFQVGADKLPISLTVKLAGDAALPVTGILLNPQGSGLDYETLQDFELWLSQDGRDFTQALAGSLSSALVEQAFPLPQTVPARYAQLRFLSNHVGNRGNVALGEWKVVVAPGSALDGPIDLAAPANGGEIVTFRPQPYSPDDVAGMLKADKRATRIAVPAGTRAEWVLGFQHGRAAQVASLQWVDAPDVTGAERFTDLDVSASLDSPVGPWTPIGHWKLTPGQSVLTLPAPAWARYLRFVPAAPANVVRLALPDVLRVIERPISADYRSIIGEWGHYSREGVYEWLNPPPAAVRATAVANAAVDKAQAIVSKSPVQGTVQISQTVAWYRIDVPAGQNAVVLHLAGQPTVNVRAVFQDAAGKTLPVTSEPVSPAEQVITATVPGGSTAYFRIEEPPRSVIFAWDNSSSLGAYQNTIYNALMSYVAGVMPGREVVNLLPFGGKLILKQWGEDPTVLQQALNNYNRSDSSSNAEESLLKATQELAYREGTKAVVFITDAESTSVGYELTAKLWDALVVVRPRVFTLEISTSAVRVGDAPAEPQDIMQNYAAVNGGYYDYLRTTGDLDVVFARVAAWLRRPAAYTFVANTVALPPPGPGKLTVLSSITGQDATAAASLLGNTAVEIIFDASGSMTQPLGKSTRIAVAHDVLNNLVDNVLPKGIPLALRAFGNREGNYSCRTDLEVPLGPLDPAALKKAVAAIQPQNLGATPIAASLLKVPEDLKNAGPGPKLIILITDGEESCQGDVAAAAQSLRKQGFDVRVNIVGLAVTDTKIKDELAKWAAAGGGQFFAAADQQALARGLDQALRVPYRVLDDKGQVVAQGLVDGDPIELPAGVYRVEVATNPAKTVENVSITSSRDTVVRFQGGQ